MIPVPDRTPSAIYKDKPDANGLYGAPGTKFPRGAIGTSAVIVLEEFAGEYEVIVSQRSAKMRVHPLKWGLLGGYLDLQSAESGSEAAAREAFEETNRAVLVNPTDGILLTSFMDYNDFYNHACCALGYLFVIAGDEAREVKKRLANTPLDSEVNAVKVVKLDAGTPALLDNWGGFAYAHEKRNLIAAMQKLGILPAPAMPKRGIPHPKP